MATTTSKVSVTEGSGANLATQSFTEDAVTKHYTRIGTRYVTSAPTLANNEAYDLRATVGGFLLVSQGDLSAGENLTTNRQMVEHAYNYSRKTADGQVMAAAGFVHTITISPLTATPTAGLLTVYDNTAESGTAIYTEWVFATTAGHTVQLDVACATGCYVGFDATLANVAVTVSYRLN